MKKFLGFLFAIVLASTGIAKADDAADNKAKIESLQQKVDILQSQLEETQIGLNVLKAQSQSATSKAATSEPVSTAKANNVTFNIGGEAVTVYGNVDLSYDLTGKGLAQYYPSSKDSPLGNTSYVGALSSNLSNIGLRGTHKIGGSNLGLLYQFETQLDVTATPGTANTNSNNSGDVKGALVSRNSFIGLGNKYVGAVKLGKTDAPYKTATARMNPFNGMLGDYAVVMGNSGGDNRVEFGTRFDHALWYESPSKNGFAFGALVSPGQNRAPDNSNIAAGQASCTGGNLPGSGATPPQCNDGSFGSAYSYNVSYLHGPVYLTAAYELHRQVNRTSDLATYDPNDVADEDATKFGVQLKVAKRTTLNAVWESLNRYVPQYLQYQNERTRNGFWLAATQLVGKDSASGGWARANPSPGDPGQHNTSGGLRPDNMANLFTFAYQHPLDRWVSIYADWALTVNHRDAHYDLGAGGRGLTTDCHDAAQLAAIDLTTGLLSGNGPHCYAGGRLQGLSTGLQLKF